MFVFKYKEEFILKKETKNKIIEYFNQLELEEANALNLQDNEAYNIALAKIQSAKSMLNILNIQVDGINKE